MSTEDNLIRLTIFGEEYTVKSKADETYLREIARYVDRHMQEISENLPQNQPTLRIAMLAAMNITDELFGLREQTDELKRTYELKTAELTNRVEAALAKHSMENNP